MEHIIRPVAPEPVYPFYFKIQSASALYSKVEAAFTPDEPSAEQQLRSFYAGCEIVPISESEYILGC